MIVDVYTETRWLWQLLLALRTEKIYVELLNWSFQNLFVFSFRLQHSSFQSSWLGKLKTGHRYRHNTLHVLTTFALVLESHWNFSSEGSDLFITKLQHTCLFELPFISRLAIVQQLHRGHKLQVENHFLWQWNWKYDRVNENVIT